MREILGKAKTVRELLKGVKYSIDYYQREYKWHDKQIRELVDDLSGKFLEDYQPDHERSKVADYPRYFLGSIIISKKDGGNFIVDGQQRLTSLTLLLILLRNLQRQRPEQVNVDELIFSEKFGQKSFNIHVDERIPAMEALFDAKPIDVTDRPESVQILVQRYRDLEEAFPEDLRSDALPYFIDWLLENVHLVEITAYSDDDAYTIFETMNDRGLSLAPIALEQLRRKPAAPMLRYAQLQRANPRDQRAAVIAAAVAQPPVSALPLLRRQRLRHLCFQRCLNQRLNCRANEILIPLPKRFDRLRLRSILDPGHGLLPRQRSDDSHHHLHSMATQFAELSAQYRKS